MWKTYGEYLDDWIARREGYQGLGDPNYAEIWDFTDAEMKAILKWCMKRGQQSATVAWALDMALDGRTDIDFAVILGSKTLYTGLRLSQARQRRVSR